MRRRWSAAEDLGTSGRVSRRVRPALRRLAGLAALCSPLACGPGPDPPPAPVDGQQAYAMRCGYCHDVPNGIGAALTPRTLAAYGTLGALDGYLRVAMPHEAPGSLPTAEYDAILAYLIESRELVPDGEDVDALPDSTTLRPPA